MGIKGVILKGVYYTTLNGFGIHVRIHFSRKSIGKTTSPLDYSVVALVPLYIHRIFVIGNSIEIQQNQN
jgi:hypothetical protein